MTFCPLYIVHTNYKISFLVGRFIYPDLRLFLQNVVRCGVTTSRWLKLV